MNLGALTGTNCTNDINPVNGSFVQSYSMANINGSSNSCDGCSIANVSVCILPVPQPPPPSPFNSPISFASIFSQILSPHLNALSTGLDHITDSIIPAQNNNENYNSNCESQSSSINQLTHSVNSLKKIVSDLNVDVRQIVKLLSSIIPNPNQLNVAPPLILNPISSVEALNANPLGSGSSELNLGSLLDGAGGNLNSQLLNLIQQSPAVALPTDTQKPDPIDQVLNLVKRVNDIKSNFENDLQDLL